VVLPKRVRDRLGLRAGSPLKMTETTDGVTLRPAEERPPLVSLETESSTSCTAANEGWIGGGVHHAIHLRCADKMKNLNRVVRYDLRVH